MSYTRGTEYRVNKFAPGSQGQSSVAVLLNGDHVVTWTSPKAQDGSGSGVYRLEFYNDFPIFTSDQRVNTYKTGNQAHSSVSALNDGGYIISWDSYGQDGSGLGIYQQRFDRQGVATGAEIRVNKTTAHDQLGPTTTALKSGGWVVAWTSDGQDGSHMGVYQQAYKANGQKLGSETRVNTHTKLDQEDAAIAGLVDGGWVVTWESNGQEGKYDGVYQQRFSATGQKVGGEVHVNTYVTLAQDDAAITALQDGGWVVAWESDGQDGDDNGVYMQRYNAAGHKVGSEAQVNVTVKGAQEDVAITGLADGGYVVVWQSENQDGDGYGIYCRIYGADGKAKGGERIVNGTTTGDQYHAAVAAFDDGSFEVSWTSEGGDSDGTGIMRRKFSYMAETINGTPDKDVLNGTKLADIISGLASDDTINGNGGDDLIYGGDGNDTIRGGTGDDIIYGGGGNDVFDFNTGDGADTIEDFDILSRFTDFVIYDRIDLKGLKTITDYADLVANHMTEVGDDVLIDGLNGDTITLKGIALKDLSASNFIFA